MSVWDEIDSLVAAHKATRAALKAAGDENKCGTRPSNLNALHWVASCRRRDCGEEVIGTAEQLQRLMAEHTTGHDAKQRLKDAKKREAKAAERTASATKKQARGGAR